jgi:hypothetical protein
LREALRDFGRIYQSDFFSSDRIPEANLTRVIGAGGDKFAIVRIGECGGCLRLPQAKRPEANRRVLG